MLNGVDTRWRMMLTCSRAFSTDSMAQGSEPNAPPCAAAITSSASMIPAIGARTMGNSVLKRARSRRSGHMVSSFRVDGGSAWASMPKASTTLAPPARRSYAKCYAQVLGYGLMPDAPAPQRDDGPDGFDQAERPGALQESVDRTERAGDGKSEDEPMAAVLQRVAHEHRGDGEQTK